MKADRAVYVMMRQPTRYVIFGMYAMYQIAMPDNVRPPTEYSVSILIIIGIRRAFDTALFKTSDKLVKYMPEQIYKPF